MTAQTRRVTCQSPQTALLAALGRVSLLEDLARDVRLCLAAAEMPAWRKTEAALAMINDVLPAPGTPAAPGYVPPGTDAAGVAALIAGRLRGHPAMATDVIQAYAGEPVTVTTTRAGRWAIGTAPAGHLPFDGGELARLRVPAGTWCWWREGTMLTRSGILAARVKVLVVPDRLPAQIRRKLGGPVPFGTLIGACSPARQARAAAPAGTQASSTAAVHLGGAADPCALAWEQVTGEFTGHVAKTAAGRG